MKLKFLLLILSFLIFACETNKEEDMEEAPIITALNKIQVKIENPLNFDNTYPGKQINFKAFLNADSTVVLTNLKAKWISDKDGLIFEENIDINGETSFSSYSLSPNIHKIKLNISNEVDSIISDSIEIYNAIRLLPNRKTNSSFTLKWTSLKDSNFESFSLYRSRFKSTILNDEPIYTTNNIQDTTFIDTTAFLGEQHFYKVILNRTIQTPSKFESNIDSIKTGKFINTDYPILKIIPDFKRNYAYGIVNTTSIFGENETGYGLIFINLNNFRVEDRILQDIRFSDLDMDPSGDYLYLSSRSNNIHKINLNTKTLESYFFISRTAHKLEVGNNGKLYYHITPPSSGNTQFRVYDLDNDVNIPSYTTIFDTDSEFRHGDFEIDENNILYHGGSNSSRSKLSKIGTDDNRFSLLKEWDSNNYQSAKIVLNNKKLYWNQYLLDLDLNVLGTFKNKNGNSNIQDVSPDGNYALGKRNVFKSDNQTMLKEIPAFFDSGIFVNDSTILLHKSRSSIYKKFESTIYLYNIK